MWICASIRRVGLEFNDPPTPPEEDFIIYQTIEQQWKTSQHFEQVQEVFDQWRYLSSLTKLSVSD
ncbi:hypothetical protein GGR55DRAFT_225293 [Xylaria sp. FL0064]|nr:hypothetical protein GGR55DRAFT_225293 [Xylaria sp. FL0064]